MKPTENVQSGIPAISSREEEADFWDTHSLADFEDEFEPIEVEGGGLPRHGVTVSLESKDFHRLIAVGKANGVGATAQARLLVLDGLARVEGLGQGEPDSAAVG